MKKTILLTLGLATVLYCTIFSPVLPAYAAPKFEDLASTHWAYSSIQWAQENGIVEGYPDGTFRPSKNVSEAEFLKMFIQTYRDIEPLPNSTHWADSVYAIAQTNNYPVKSYTDHTYRNKIINRQSVAELIAAADGTSYMGDQAIQYLLDQGYSHGKTENSVKGYKGNDPLTRAEAVQFIKNVKDQGMKDIQPRPETKELDEPSNPNSTSKTAEYNDLLSTDGMYELTKEEKELARLINEYREELGLPLLKVSKSLTKVARYHVYDSNIHSPSQGNCNLHSWSETGEWTGGCYTPDHKNASLMWDKPKELTNGTYTGNGYEISYWHSAQATPAIALEAWKKSSGHHNVIIGDGFWSNLTVMGIAVQGEYAHIWFGVEADPNGYFEY